jgi:hypothetical protein
MHNASWVRLMQGSVAHGTPRPKSAVAKATRASTAWHPIGTGWPWRCQRWCGERRRACALRRKRCDGWDVGKAGATAVAAPTGQMEMVSDVGTSPAQGMVARPSSRGRWWWTVASTVEPDGIYSNECSGSPAHRKEMGEAAGIERGSGAPAARRRRGGIPERRRQLRAPTRRRPRGGGVATQWGSQARMVRMASVASQWKTVALQRPHGGATARTTERGFGQPGRQDAPYTSACVAASNAAHDSQSGRGTWRQGHCLADPSHQWNPI